MRIDLNADMGESFGAYTLGHDSELMEHITSANVACGFHAGDPQVMQDTVKAAIAHNVAIGAHPGLHDLAGFGRRMIQASPREIEADVLYQIGALDAFARANGAALVHVKAHGALYNWAATDLQTARAIARAVASYNPHLILVCLSGSAMVQAAEEMHLRVAREGFADRAYNADGTLVSRLQHGAVLTDPERAAAQALQIAVDRTVSTLGGKTIPLLVDTLCLHGDNPAAVENARLIRETLEANGIAVTALAHDLS